MTQKIAENKKYNAIAFRCWIEEKGYKKSTTGWFETIYADAPGPYTSRKISHVAKTDSELYDIFATSQQDPESVCPICDGRGRVSYYTGEDGGKEKGEQVEVTPEAAALAKDMMTDLAAKVISSSQDPDDSASYERWLDKPGLDVSDIHVGDITVQQVEGKSETPSHTDDIIFPFSGYALREGYFGGKYHGYPECCILWYLGETEIHKKSKEDLQGIDVLKNGFLPCPQHQDMIRDGEIRIEDLIQNRICPEPFSELPELNAGQYPLIESNQTDIKRIGLKAFDDSMKNTLGELIEAEESPFAESEADQQVPEEVKAWVQEQSKKLIAEEDYYNFPRVFAETAMIAMYHHLQPGYKSLLESLTGYNAQMVKELTAEKEVNATLRSSGQTAGEEYRRDLEIVKGERNELRDLLNILNEGYSDHFTKFLNDRIYKALKKFTNNKDNA